MNEIYTSKKQDLDSHICMIRVQFLLYELRSTYT